MVFRISLFLVVALVVLAGLAPQPFEAAGAAALAQVIRHAGWLYLLIVFLTQPDGALAQLFGGADMVGALANGYATVLFRMYDTLPFSALLSSLTIVLLVIFFVTSADSAVLVLGSMSSETAGDPSLARKLAWGISIALVAVAMLMAGGLAALQTLITVAALPFALLMVAVMVGLYRVLRMEALREKAENRRARHAIQEWIAREQEQRPGDDVAGSGR